MRNDISHKTFDMLTVIGFHSYTYDKNNNVKNQYWICQCECGEVVVVRKGSLTSGSTKSCGRHYKYVPDPSTHKMCYTRFHRIWTNMKARCSPKCDKDNIKYYYGRGIRVCDSWKTFQNFYNDMYQSYVEHVNKHGEKDTTIDRIDSRGHYEPTNCRWATVIEQNNNKRQRTKVLT